MVRRGRGGAAVVGKSSPLNPDSDATTMQLSQAEEEEERGYDYVEVMACPSGCVNGGGQIRPPTQADVASSSTDPEGYTDGSWAADQSNTGATNDDLDSMLNKSCYKKAASSALDESDDIDMAGEKEIKGWQGTSKEWVRRVEEAYWQGSRVAHTPVNVVSINSAGGVASDSGASTPTLVNSGSNTPLSSNNAKSIRVEDHQRLLEALSVTQKQERKVVGEEAMAYADVLANLVVKELCTLTAESGDEGEMEKARNKLFRTQYRAVQDEAVNGLAVQW